MVVAFACNDSYINQTAISMVSLVQHNPGVELYLISDHISITNLDLLINILGKLDTKVNIIEADDILQDVCISPKGRHPRTIYTKLFFDEVIDAEKILYLDSDVVITGSLEELFERNMENELVAGVMMPYSSDIKCKAGLAKEDPYICDGIVLLNLNKWKAMKINLICRELLSDCKGIPYMLSEGILNYVCKGFIGVLSPRYNLMPSAIYYSQKQILKIFKPDYYYNQQELRNAVEKPLIIHFMSELYNRPWFEPCDHPFREEYRSIDRKLFGRRDYKIKNISLQTRMNRWLYDNIPFVLYLLLYRCKHGATQIWRRK